MACSATSPLRVGLLLLVAAVSMAARCEKRNSDVDGDGVANIVDVAVLASCIGLDPASVASCEKSDLDRDGDVDVADFDLLSVPIPGEAFPGLDSAEPADGDASVPTPSWPRLAFDGPPPEDSADRMALACDGSGRAAAVHRLADGVTLVLNPEADLPPDARCALVWHGDARRHRLSFATAGLGAPAEVRYDRRDGSRPSPFPDDFFLVPDATMATGVRVEVPVPSGRPGDVTDLFAKLVADTAGLDGFSPQGPFTVELSAAPDPATLPLSPEASLEPLASVGLFDLTPGSPTRGQRVPFALHVREDSIAGLPTSHNLVIFPSINLSPGGRYGLVVTRRAGVSATRPLAPSGFTAAALAPPQPGEEPEIAAARALATDVLDGIALHGELPIPAADVALALRISVRSTGDIPADPLAMKAQVAAAPPPAFTITEVEDRNGALGMSAIVRGTWAAPDWRTDNRIARDAEGLPVITGTVDVPFVLVIPEAAEEGPVPIIFYQHGNPGSAETTVFHAGQGPASDGFAVVGFTDPLNLEIGNDVELQILAIFANLLLGNGVLDFWMQTYGEQLAFLRLIEGLGGLDVHPVGAPDGVPDLDPGAPLAYVGASQGANHGQALLAYAPEVRAGLLLAGGLRMSELLFHQDGGEPGAFSFMGTVPSYIPNIEAPDVWVALSLFQMIFDRQDPQNHAAFIYRDPIEVAGSTRKPSIFAVEGLFDRSIPTNASRALSWTLDLPILAPVREAVPYLRPPVGGPLAGNVDAETTAAVAQYVPDGVPGRMPDPGCEGETNGHYCAQNASRPQQRAFLLSALQDPVPVLTGDADLDGLRDLDEPGLGTDPLDPDSDDDGLDDGTELAFGLDPLDGDDAAFDLDSDGLDNAQEIALGTDLRDADTDGDGLDDGAEVGLGTDPRRADTDGGGRSDAEEVQVDGTDPLDPADDLPIVPLALDLFDGEGWRWDVVSRGRIGDGTDDAFDFGMTLRVGTPALASFVGLPEALLEEDGRELVVGPDAIGPLVVRRKIFVPETAAFARHLDLLENPTWQPVTASWQLTTGYGGSAVVVETSDGDPTLEPTDDWAIVDDADGTGVPSVALVHAGPGAAQEPSAVAAFTTQVSITYTVEVPARGRVAFLHFARQAGDRAAATASAASLSSLLGAATGALSREERRDVVNFAAFPDADADGLDDSEEIAAGTDPGDPDSDGDGLLDGFEFEHGFDPVATDESAEDPDGDGLDNGAEQAAGSDPHAADADGDGLDDAAEVALGSDPNHADSDDDGLSDGEEAALGTNPRDPDSDGAGRTDSQEIGVDGTDPLDPRDDLGRLFASGQADRFYTFDAETGALEDQVTATLPGRSINSIRGMAMHPQTGEIWAAVVVSGEGTRIATIDPDTGLATEVGDPGAGIHALAFDPDGTLYGMAWNSDPVGGMLLEIDPSDGMPTPLFPVSVGDHRESLAWDTADGRLVHASTHQLSSDIERIDLSTSTARPLLPYGDPLDPVDALTVGNDGSVLVLADETLSRIDSDGLVTRVTPLSGSFLVGAVVAGPGLVDLDRDRLPAWRELAAGTALDDPDSDDDGLGDRFEVDFGLDPLGTDESMQDPDGDGLDNLAEQAAGSDPGSADGDGDGLADPDEIALGTGPLDPDSDGDGLSDGAEVAAGTDPLDSDSDDGGRTDGAEVLRHATDPLDPADDRLLYSLSSDNRLHVLDAVTGAVRAAVTLSLPGKDLNNNTQALAVHPGTGELWALVKPRGQTTLSLVTVDPATGVATERTDAVPFTVSAMAFDDTGRLFGHSDATTSESVVEIDPDTGQLTHRKTLPSTSELGTLAFDSQSGLLHRLKRSEWDVVDPATWSLTTVPLSASIGPVVAEITYDGSGVFLAAANGRLYEIRSDATVRPLPGALDHDSRGLAVRQQGP